MPPLRRKPIRSSTSSSRATAAATTAPATQTVSEVTSILPPDPHTSSTAVRPVPPATLSLAEALPEEPTPAMLLEEEALSSETSGSSEGSLLSTLEELEEEEEPVTPTRLSKPSYTNSSSSKSISQRRKSVVPSEARRWDQTSSHPGRTPPPSARRRSWRCYRHDILSALEYCAGDGACVRRYLLYHHNINIPSKIIRYYKSSSRSSDLQEGRSSGGSRTSPRQPAES